MRLQPLGHLTAPRSEAGPPAEGASYTVEDQPGKRRFAIAPAPPGPKIQIAKHKYDRPTLTVPVGTTVTWLNKDEDVHTVVSTTLTFRSPGLETDDAYSYRFTKPGVYQYFCTHHPLMTGKVIVK